MIEKVIDEHQKRINYIISIYRGAIDKFKEGKDIKDDLYYLKDTDKRWFIKLIVFLLRNGVNLRTLDTDLICGIDEPMYAFDVVESCYIEGYIKDVPEYIYSILKKSKFMTYQLVSSCMRGTINVPYKDIPDALIVIYEEYKEKDGLYGE